jgi:hypothetical protein
MTTVKVAVVGAGHLVPTMQKNSSTSNKVNFYLFATLILKNLKLSHKNSTVRP